ncbi:hypothetical protein F8G81_05475 [Arthrobacter sp. CDRTa11]|uniref:hypothetical protein n=1 Tax=Arthrobacter sp. CDRTa11 TaxID=2651199 RepID=UPI002265EB1D|nr:hypothetical protein [Arthrobacter sp. CDRTa11]UZX02129.1 hypothetical protein F8G81_05475 [Arthrobacter sp. CDRTa11]
MADSKSRGRGRREAREQADTDPTESANSIEKDQEPPADKEPDIRRVPGLHGYDPSQWPDTAT